MTGTREKRMMKTHCVIEDIVAHLITVAMSNVLITIIRLYTTNYVACGGQLHHLRASFEQLEYFNEPCWLFAPLRWRRSRGSPKAAWQSSACWWCTLLTVCLFTLTACWGSSVNGSDVLQGCLLKHQLLKKSMFRWMHFFGHNICEPTCLVQSFHAYQPKRQLCILSENEVILNKWPFCFWLYVLFSHWSGVELYPCDMTIDCSHIRTSRALVRIASWYC